MEEFVPKKKNKIFTKEFMAKYAYVFVLGVILLLGVSYSITFFIQNRKIASGSITTAGLEVTYTDRSLSASGLTAPTTDQEGLSEYTKAITLTNTTSNDGIVTMKITRTSGLNLTDMRYALVINGAIQEIGDVPSDGVILNTAILGNEVINAEVKLWPKTSYSGSTTTFAGTLDFELKYLGEKASNKSGLANAYVNFNCSGNNCEVWRIVKVESGRLVLTREADLSGASERTDSGKYNSSLSFNDDSMITSVSTDNKNVYLAKTVKISGGEGTQASPYTLTNDIEREADKKITAVITYKDTLGTTIGTQYVYYGQTNYISQVVNDPTFGGWTDGTNDYKLGDTVTFTSDTNLTAKIVETLKNKITTLCNDNNVTYVEKYNATNNGAPIDTPDGSGNEDVCFYTSDNSNNLAGQNGNVIFGDYCWQIVRTTADGGVKLIYNGKAEKEIELTTETLEDSDINYTNDGTYPYTYNSTTKKWTSTNHTDDATGTFIFTVKDAGEYIIDYAVSSETNWDKAKFYKNNSLIGNEYSGTVSGTLNLGTLTTSDEIKVEYSKDSSASGGTDNVIFGIAEVTARQESDDYSCKPDRTASEYGLVQRASGSAAFDGTGEKTFGDDYEIFDDNGTYKFRLKNTNSYTWTDNTYKNIIGKYACGNFNYITGDSTTCTWLYYVYGRYSSTQPNAMSYVIEGTGHFSQIAKIGFGSAARSLSEFGYMKNEQYDTDGHNFMIEMSKQFVSKNGMSTSSGYSYYYGDDVSWDGTEYNVTLNGSTPSSTTNWADIKDNVDGMYTCRSTHQATCSTVYYVVSHDANNIYYITLSSSDSTVKKDKAVTYNIADSYVEENGEYRLVNPSSTTIYYKDWYTNYNNYNNKYMCSDYTSSTCNTLYSLSATQDYMYVNTSDKTYTYANDVVYENGEYKLVLSDPTNKPYIETFEWAKEYKNLNNMHYTCMGNYDKANNSCGGSIYFINYVTSPDEVLYYIKLENGDTIESVIEKSYNYSNSVSSTLNTKNSIVKSAIDDWYVRNLSSLGSLLDDNAVFCNDRSITSLGGFSKTGNMYANDETDIYIKFKNYYPIPTKSTASLSCTNITDRFSKNNNIARLNYSIGMLSLPEAGMMQSSYSTTSHEYWLISPGYYRTWPYNSFVLMSGGISYNTFSQAHGVRPVIVLKPGVEISGGDGTYATPYVIDTTGS